LVLDLRKTKRRIKNKGNTIPTHPRKGGKVFEEDRSLKEGTSNKEKSPELI